MAYPVLCITAEVSLNVAGCPEWRRK